MSAIDSPRIAYIQNVWDISDGKSPFGKTRRICGGNIKMVLLLIYCIWLREWMKVAVAVKVDSEKADV